MNRLLGAASALALSLACAAHASTVTVTPATWWATMKAAKPGDVINLGPGTYGAVAMGSGVANAGWNVAAPGTTVTCDPAAVISGFSVSYSSGWTFKGCNAQMTPATQYGFAVTNSSNIQVIGGSVRQADGKTLAGTGIWVRGSTGVLVQGVDVGWVGDGIDGMDSSQVMFTGNSIHDFQTNAMFVLGFVNSTISNNTGTNAHTAGGGHPDFIQFGASPTRATSGIVINGNRYELGSGDPVQGGFGTANNLTLTGNILIGMAQDGIVVSNAQTAMICGNYLQTLTTGATATAVYVRNASTNVTVCNNAVPSNGGKPAIVIGVTGDAAQPTNVTVTGNTMTTPAAPGDETEVNAWLAALAVAGAPAAPAVAAAPAPDPLQPKLDAATAQVTSLTNQLQIATAAQQASTAQVTGLQAQVAQDQQAIATAQQAAAAAQAQASAAQAADQADQAKIAAAKAALQ